MYLAQSEMVPLLRPHSVVNLDASRWCVFRLFLKFLINQSKNVDERQSQRAYDLRGRVG